MSFKKHIFEQFGKQINEESQKHDAYMEKRAVKFSKCPHKNITIKDGEARCSCGAAWRGPRLADLLKLLKEDKWRLKRKQKK